MTAPGRLWLALWPIGVACGALDVYIVASSNHDKQVAAAIALALTLTWSFMAAGLVAWARRPDNRIGALMVAVGFMWFAGTLGESNSPLLFTFAAIVGALPLAGVVHLLVVYPGGRLETTRERVLVYASYPTAILAGLTGVLVDPTPQNGCAGCPRNLALVVASRRTATVLDSFWSAVGLVIMAIVAVMLVARWRRAAPATRRVLVPVYAGGLASVILVGTAFALNPIEGVSNFVAFLGLLSVATVPFLFLAGLLRTRLARAGAVRLLRDAPSTTETEASLRRALNDPTLRLLIACDEGGYVDAAGAPAECPVESPAAAVSVLRHDGRPLAAVLHDPSLRTEPELLDDVLTTARVALVQNRSVEALRASERRNRALLDAIPDYMFRVARDGTYLDYHAHVTDGALARPDFIGSNVRDHLPADVADAIVATIGRVLDTGETEVLEEVIPHDGTVSTFESRVVKSDEDEVITIVRDVTGRRRAEDEIRRQRDFLRTVVNAASSIFCVLSPEGNIIRFNEACEHLTGHPDDERVRGRPFWEAFVGPGERESVESAFRSDRPGVVFEHAWMTAAGGRLLIEWSSTPLVDESGAERRLIHGVDVTERERHERELREGYTFLNTIARATPSMLAVIEADGRVGRNGVSAAFSEVLGWSDEEAIGRPLSELIAPDSPSAHTTIVQAIVGGSLVEREGVWVTRDGRRISVEWSIRPLGELRGRRSYLVCGVDVTEQKRQQEELRRSRSRLVEAEAAERRRLERNLHDGAQQRLVSLSLALRMAQSRLVSDPGGAFELLSGASAELALALEELRELARGIHPAVLTDRGLAAALDTLAERATLPVEIESAPETKLPEQVEAAAFYVVSESLANVAKYAHASVARVRVTVEDGEAVVEVADDGVGGADERRGSGLRGLRDRLDALDGLLTVNSPPGQGTLVRAAIPVPASGEPGVQLGSSHRAR